MSSTVAKRVPLGPTGEAVRANIKKIREEQNLSYAELSRRLAQVSRPMRVQGLRRIEAGERRVDVDDLVALSAALGVVPADLLGIHIPSERMFTDKATRQMVIDLLETMLQSVMVQQEAGDGDD